VEARKKKQLQGKCVQNNNGENNCGGREKCKKNI
jgi:hypothetical protein